MFSYWFFSPRLLTCLSLTFLFRNQFVNPLLLKGTIINHCLYSWFSSSFLPSQHTLIWFQGQHNIKTVSPATDHLFELNPVWILVYLSTSLLRDISCVLKCLFLAKAANVALPLCHLAAILLMLRSFQSIVWLWLLLSSRPSGTHSILPRTLFSLSLDGCSLSTSPPIHLHFCSLTLVLSLTIAELLTWNLFTPFN